MNETPSIALTFELLNEIVIVETSPISVLDGLKSSNASGGNGSDDAWAVNGTPVAKNSDNTARKGATLKRRADRLGIMAPAGYLGIRIGFSPLRNWWRKQDIRPG